MQPTELLLEEYKLCQKKTEQLEDTIWKTSGAIGFSSLGTFVATLFQPTPPKWQTILILGFLVSGMSIIWWFMARRWWDIQHTTFLRMRHLEEHLQFYQVHYIFHRDGKLDLKKDIYSRRVNDLNDDGKDKKYYLRGVQSWLRLLPWWIIPISWIAYAFYRWDEQTCFFHTWGLMSLTRFIIWVGATGAILALIFLINYHRIARTLSSEIKGRIKNRYPSKK